MLKRAKCTLYLIQETDTMGKDSEMASTLAQGKPVIAYLPTIDINSEIEELTNRTSPKIIIEKTMALRKFMKPKSRMEIENILFNSLFTSPPLNDYELVKLFSTVRKLDLRRENFQVFLKKLTQIRADFYDQRAKILTDNHPLRFQINLQIGVANGLLVSREEKQCSELINRILTNQLEFDICEPRDTYPSINSDSLNFRLIEKITKCPFRVVTQDEKVTNSFWNLYKVPDINS